MPISFGGLLCLLATGSGQQEARGGTPGVQHGEACSMPHWPCFTPVHLAEGILPPL